jgi:hypothetical protein
LVKTKCEFAYFVYFRVYAKIIWSSYVIFNFEYLLQGWVVANHKSSRCPASNSNLHESPMKNLLNPFRREGLLYLIVLEKYDLSVYVLYFLHTHIHTHTYI